MESLDPKAAAADIVVRSTEEIFDSDVEMLTVVGGPPQYALANFVQANESTGPASSHGWRAVMAALTQKGMKERGCGTNDNPYSRYFGKGPQAWCADFVSWAFDSTGNQDRKVPWGPPSLVSNITSWGSRTNNLIRGPRAGCIFTYNNGQHTGLVVRLEAGRFLTVEGNTSGPDGTVCWVWTHARTDNGQYSFVRVPD